jgi:hypothetical protein
VPAAIDGPVSGFVDYLDERGRWVGEGNTPPPEAVFVRRWSIEPAGAAADAVVLQVVVQPIAARQTGGGGVGIEGQTRLVTVLARRAR